ncbi:FKBP-type peptidyl-prolyl cis-trans isomerase [Thioalkalivibrio sp. AKL17]|uniref:FKBP-type peptidyl-prolyl cis-trans isomerase n=1 Tax=Thioalkalivibrio sp. AKL17 TaxID=1158160 RepID=UPI0003626BFA|nr:FKBP-type peptidyl-prolyl cis-trans isomerase [Thioalkalivibrio sp. AKL17]
MKAWLFAIFITLILPATALAENVQIRDLEKGEGPEVVRHDTVTVHYTGWVYEDGEDQGEPFDSSRDRGQPFTLTLGAGEVIPGWEKGLEGMREGGKREIIIPPELGYGSRGAGDVIPPNATLRFEVEILEVERAPFGGLNNNELAGMLERDDVTIIDIRRPDEWAETGVVKGSLRMTAFDERGQFIPQFGQAFTDAVDPDDTVVLICRTGSRTGVLARALADGLGYGDVHNVTDGIKHWLEEDRVVQHDCPDTEETAVC